MALHRVEVNRQQTWHGFRDPLHSNIGVTDFLATIQM